MRASPAPQAGGAAGQGGDGFNQPRQHKKRVHGGRVARQPVAMQPFARRLGFPVGPEARPKLREAIEGNPMRLCARFVAGVSGNQGDTVHDAVIRPAVVAALNGLLGGAEEQILADQVSIVRQPCKQGLHTFITVRVEGRPDVLRPLNTAVEAQGALVLDWGRQSHVLAQLQPSMDPAEAQVLVRVMCASPMRPTGLVETMRHLGVDARWAVRVDVPSAGQGEPRVVNPWGDAAEVMADPAPEVVRLMAALERQGDGYMYLMLAGGAQDSQKRLAELVDHSRGANNGFWLGAAEDLEGMARDAEPPRVRLGRVFCHVPPLEGVQLEQPPAAVEQGPQPKRRAAVPAGPAGAKATYAVVATRPYVITAVQSASGGLRRVDTLPQGGAGGGAAAGQGQEGGLAVAGGGAAAGVVQVEGAGDLAGGGAAAGKVQVEAREGG